MEALASRDAAATASTSASALNGVSGGSDEMSISQTSNTSSNGHSEHSNGSGRKSSITSPDPTAYVAKARVTRPTPPPPSYNPMQFVQVKPCNLYQTAQEQLKKAEEVKKIKEIKKEEPEEWQNNLDNWKSSRRKRVEHIIDRVVEVKKLELEEHDRTRRKSKTFSEMIENRGERVQRPGLSKLVSLAVYAEDESNDLSDLGIGTSSASGKSSLSEDYDNNSVLSDNAELDKVIYENKNGKANGKMREYISSPGYDTSSSTAPGSSPDPCEYTYEGAIQDYKQRVSRAQSSGSSPYKTATTPMQNGNGVETPTGYPTRRGSKIEDRLIGFEVSSPSDAQEGMEKQKVDVPKVDISKRKEIFESQNNSNSSVAAESKHLGAAVPKVTLRERFKIDENGSKSNAQEQIKKEVKRLSGDVVSIRNRLQSFESGTAANANASNGTAAKQVDIPVPPLKERLCSLQNAATKEEVKKPPVVLIDARQLEIMRNEDELKLKQIQQQEQEEYEQEQQLLQQQQQQLKLDLEHDGNDSGIHNSDHEASLSEEQKQMQNLQELREKEKQLNEAIAALAIEEKQLEDAANAVNKIEAEFAELSAGSSSEPQPSEMEFSINEALEIALEAIDKESPRHNDQKQQQQHLTNDDIETLKQAELSHNKQRNLNKTDEEKVKQEMVNESETSSSSNSNLSKQQQQFEMDVEAHISREPIYENVLASTTAAATTAVEQHLAIIPSQHQQQQQQQAAAEKLQSKLTNSNNNYFNNNLNEHKQNINQLHSNKLSHAAANKKQQQQQQQHCYDEVDSSSSSSCDGDSLLPAAAHHQQLISQTNSKNLAELTNAFANITTATTKTTKTSSIVNKEFVASSFSNNNNNNHTDNTHQLINNNIKPSNFNNNLNESLQPALPTTPPPSITAATANTLKTANNDGEPYYQVPKPIEPYYDAPKHLRPIPLYENIDIFYNGLENASLSSSNAPSMEPPKEKPPPPPTDSPPLFDDADNEESEAASIDMPAQLHRSNGEHWPTTAENTYETIASRNGGNHLLEQRPTPPIKRVNSTKRIKKELRNKRSSFLGIESKSLDDEEMYLELTVAPPPDMAQLLQEERRLEKQLYLKAGLCDSSDTGESRDSGVSENHSRQSSEHYTNSSEENDRIVDTPPSMQHNSGLNSTQLLYQTEGLLTAAQTPLLQTVKGNSADAWTESATVAAAASQSLTEATATANAKMHSIEEKIREQEEVLRVERELLQLEQEELKRQRESLIIRENLARRELQHGAKMLMSAAATDRRSLQDLQGIGGVNITTSYAGANYATPQAALHHVVTPATQQIYANVPNIQQQYYQQVETDYRKSMSDLNEFTKRHPLQLSMLPAAPSKPMRAMHMNAAASANGHIDDFALRQQQQQQQRHSLNAQAYGGSLVKIATPTVATRVVAAAQPSGAAAHIYSNFQHQSAHNINAAAATNSIQQANTPNTNYPVHLAPGNMSRNTLHALSATPKPKYTDGWVQVQNRKPYDQSQAQVSSDAAWLTAYQQKRKSMPESAFGYNNHWLVQEAEQRRLSEQQQRRATAASTTASTSQANGLRNSKLTTSSGSNGKPLPDSIIQTLTERVQSKGIGERKRNNNLDANKSPLHAASYQQQQQPPAPQSQNLLITNPAAQSSSAAASCASPANPASQDKILSVSGKKKCSHCGDELGRGAAMIIESLLLFYHINCFKCCVCHVQLGDGLNGTDVRVRNHKLHCQNCYSSDDGIKFSCV